MAIFRGSSLFLLLSCYWEYIKSQFMQDADPKAREVMLLHPQARFGVGAFLLLTDAFDFKARLDQARQKDTKNSAEMETF